MANARDPNKSNVTVWLPNRFLVAMEIARKLPKVREDRSTFIRRAIAERLGKLGLKYEEEDVDAPDRIRRPILGTQVISNEETLAGEDPMVAEAARSLALVAMRKVLAEDRESRRRGKAVSTSENKAPPSGGFGTG